MLQTRDCHHRLCRPLDLVDADADGARSLEVRFQRRRGLWIIGLWASNLFRCPEVSRAWNPLRSATCLGSVSSSRGGYRAAPSLRGWWLLGTPLWGIQLGQLDGCGNLPRWEVTPRLGGIRPAPTLEHSTPLGCGRFARSDDSYLVDSASSYMLASKIKPCMSKYKHLYRETANGSLNHLWSI